MLADENVFQHRHLRKEFNVLEGPCNPQFCNIVRFQTDEVDLIKIDTSFVRSVDPINNVEDRCLPRAIGSNKRKNVSGWNLKTAAVQCPQTTKMNGKVLDLQ